MRRDNEGDGEGPNVYVRLGNYQAGWQWVVGLKSGSERV